MDFLTVVCDKDPALAVALVSLMLIPPVIGMLLGLMGRSLCRVQMYLCGISCCVGIMTLPVHYICSDISISISVQSAIGPYGILIDGVSALMMTVSSAVFLLVILHMAGSSHVNSTRYLASMNGLYIACMLCMCADTVAVLLIGWECVSLLTFLMNDGPEEEEHRWMFFVITHIGGLMLIGTYAYMASVTGTFVLSEWSEISSLVGTTTSSILILLLFLGFGSKLGIVPFHAWMPEMYRTTPTHTVMLLSTVCSNVAILILFKSIFGYIGISDDMNGIALVLMLLSSVSALWGAMESMIQNKPKRILAYSSMENMALVCLCMSVAIAFAPVSKSAMQLILIAGLLHTINHSLFKSLMLMTVHTVEDCTGETDINRFGGLGRTLPALSFIAVIGTASLAAIPPMNGFTSELLMLQSIISGETSESMLMLIMPLVVAVLGICGMMGATSYMRLYGFTYLGRPRSKGSEEPKSIGKVPMASMWILAIACIVTGLFALNIADVLSTGMNSFLGTSVEYKDAMSGNFEPLILGIMILGAIAILVFLMRSRKDDGVEANTWACGGTLDEDMQYSSMGFSQPLVRVFHPIYGDTISMTDDDDHKKVFYHVRFVEPFKKYIYTPVAKGVLFISRQVERIQTGNIQSYLSYMLLVIVLALLAVRLI